MAEKKSPAAQSDGGDEAEPDGEEHATLPAEEAEGDDSDNPVEDGASKAEGLLGDDEDAGAIQAAPVLAAAAANDADNVAKAALDAVVHLKSGGDPTGVWDAAQEGDGALHRTRPGAHLLVGKNCGGGVCACALLTSSCSSLCPTTRGD